MLAIIAWNQIQDAEMSGEREVVGQSKIHSKARGTTRTKVLKTPGPDRWKKKLVDDAMDKKRLYGSGLPIEDVELEKVVDEVEEHLARLTIFDDNEDDMSIFDEE
uniref:Uncharacterized protein n=1 Tax=Acrobeloides nanus TaxID=290746 RepID=A0A914EEF0_9BILA